MPTLNPIKSVFLEYNQSFPPNFTSHKYLGVQSNGKIFIAKKNERASLKRIADAVSELLSKNRYSPDTLDAMKESLHFIKAQYELKFNHSLLKRLRESRIGRIVYLVFQFFGYGSQQIESMTEAIERINSHYKTSKREVSLKRDTHQMIVEMIQKNPFKKIKVECLSNQIGECDRIEITNNALENSKMTISFDQTYQDICRILNTSETPFGPHFQFNHSAFAIPQATLSTHLTTDILKKERIKQLLDRYFPNHPSTYCYPAKNLTPVFKDIFLTYQSGTKFAIYGKDKSLSHELNEQFIHCFRQIINRIHEDDLKNDKQDAKNLCEEVVKTFQSCQAIKIQNIFQTYQCLFNSQGTFDSSILSAWIQHKENLFDSLFQKNVTKSNNKGKTKTKLDVHLRNAYLQTLGLKFGLSPLLIEGALIDPHVLTINTGSHFTTPAHLAQDYLNMLIQHFPSFVIQIARYINSYRENEIETFNQWKKKHPSLPLSFGFQSEFMRYNLGELDDADRTNPRLIDQREFQIIPHISLYEVYELLEKIGIIKLNKTFKDSKPNDSFLIKQQEIMLGDFVKKEDIDRLSWKEGINVLFEPGDPVITNNRGVNEYSCIIEQLDPMQYLHFNGKNFTVSNTSKIRKLKIPTQWNFFSNHLLKTM